MNGYDTEQEVSGEVEEGLSIGALSRATGISIHSLRMWERRYGSPAAIRRASGHRRYPIEEVDRLRAVARALAGGFRASEVVSASIEEIDGLLSGDRSGRRRAQYQPIESNRDLLAQIDDWLEASRAFDDARLSAAFERDWETLGPTRFVQDRAVHFIRKTGECWQCGTLHVAQEHFAMERMSDFLTARWREQNETLTGRPFLMATLPKDIHRLGLLMASLMTVLAGRRIVFLGTQVPATDIAEAAKVTNADAVCLSISSTVPSRFANSSTAEIRASLPGQVQMICGGNGAPEATDGIRVFNDIMDYHHWLLADQARRPT